MTEQKNDFGVGSVEQNIIRMAVPMTVAQILNLLYNLVDRMYIGHIPGASSLALTGVGITFPIISMITAFANLFGMGGAPLCSMARGRRDYDAAKRYMQNAFWMLLAAGVDVGIACSRQIRGVPEVALNLAQTASLVEEQGRAGVPLRYNYDKPEKPRRIKGFEVFSLVFSSFSKPKNHTEISRIIGGVSLTTNE